MDIKKTGIPKLDLINKMAYLRNGNVPISVVVLKGHKKNVEFVANKERDILGNYFSVLKKGSNIKENVINFVPYDVESSDVSWLTETHEIVDVDSVSIFDWNLFFKKLGLESISHDNFNDCTSEIEETLAEIEDTIITTILYDHYEKYDHNIATDEDIQKIRFMMGLESSVTIKDINVDSNNTVTENNSETIAKEAVPGVSKTEDSSINAETLSKENIVAKLKSKETKTISETNTVDISAEAISDNAKNIETISKNVAPVNTVEELKSNDDEVIPQPKISRQKKLALKSKSELTPEEIANNEQLLSEIRALYKNTLQFMREMHNSQFKNIINMMQDELDNNTFKTQFTSTYLKISEDTGTELYSRLYDVDVATQKFHKSVIHQIRHIACFNCGTEWDEEITFLKKGPHSVRCPHCFTDYPFEK